eukprot:2186382-Amphidinium_carterae.3
MEFCLNQTDSPPQPISHQCPRRFCPHINLMNHCHMELEGSLINQAQLQQLQGPCHTGCKRGRNVPVTIPLVSAKLRVSGSGNHPIRLGHTKWIIREGMILQLTLTGNGSLTTVS